MIYAGITTLIWAAAFLFTQFAQESFSSQSIGLLRYLAASAVMLVILVVKRIGFPKWKDVPKFLLAGGIGFAFYVTAFNKSVETINGATCSVISQFIPILTAVCSSVFLREKISVRGWLCIAMAFAGILVLALCERCRPSIQPANPLDASGGGGPQYLQFAPADVCPGLYAVSGDGLLYLRRDPVFAAVSAGCGSGK